jgi:hypothetical protein
MYIPEFAVGFIAGTLLWFLILLFLARKGMK